MLNYDCADKDRIAEKPLYSEDTSRESAQDFFINAIRAAQTTDTSNAEAQN